MRQPKITKDLKVRIDDAYLRAANDPKVKDAFSTEAYVNLCTSTLTIGYRRNGQDFRKEYYF